jgi:hypothetical protein
VPDTGDGFSKRNKHLITAKKAVKFDTKRAKWCTHSNLEEMYNEIYPHLVKLGLAVIHDEALWQNKAGEVSCEKDTYGMKSEYELIHQEWLVFVDEVGTSNKQKTALSAGKLTFAPKMAVRNRGQPPKTVTSLYLD